MFEVSLVKPASETDFSWIDMWNSGFRRRSCLKLCLLAASVGLFLMYIVGRNSSNLQESSDYVNPVKRPYVKKQVNTYDFLKENSLRRKNIKKVCQEHTPEAIKEGILDSNLKHIFIEEKTRLLFCEIPKVASSNIRRLMLLLTGKTNATSMKQMMPEDVHDAKYKTMLPSLYSYSKEERTHILRTYTKFFFVRHPLERVLSAYRSKFGGKYIEYFSKRYGREIIKRFRKNPTKEALEFAKDVKFSEFIQYIIQTKGKELERHWQEYNRLCHPCAIDYDFVGQYEHFQEDINFILSRVEVGNHFIPNDYDKNGRPSTSSIMADAYKNISKKHIEDLYQTFYIDHKMFGYECTVC